MVYATRRALRCPGIWTLRRWELTQIAAGINPPNADGFPMSTPGDETPSLTYLDSKGTTINPALWAIRQLHAANVTVLRIFAGGVSSSFYMIEQPGTAGADGTTWPNGELLLPGDFFSQEF